MPSNAETTNHHPDDNSSIGSVRSLLNRIFSTGYDAVGQHPDDSSSVGSRLSRLSRIASNRFGLGSQHPDDNSSVGSNDRQSHAATSIQSLAISMYEDDENTVSEDQIAPAVVSVVVLNQSAGSQSIPASELPVATIQSYDEPAPTYDDPEYVIIEKVDPDTKEAFHQADLPKMSMSEADEIIKSKLSLKTKLSYLIKDQMEPPTKDLLLEDFETLNHLVYRKYYYLPVLASLFHGVAFVCLSFNTLPWYYTLTSLGVLAVFIGRVFALIRDITSLQQAYRLRRTIFNVRLFHHFLTILANLAFFISEPWVAYSYPVVLNAEHYGIMMALMAIFITIMFDFMIFTDADKKRSLCKSNESRLFLEIYMPRNFIWQIVFPFITYLMSVFMTVLALRITGTAFPPEKLQPHVAMFSMWFPAFLPVV